VEDQAVQDARERAERRLDHMLRYARGVTCRRHALLTYFGERTEAQCGHCDVCLGRHQPDAVTPDEEPVLRHILGQAAEETPREQWFDDPPVPPPRIDELVRWLVAEGHLTLEAPLSGTFRLTEKGKRWV
jgi:ATP-dependent DNA helicase RecQ